MSNSIYLATFGSIALFGGMANRDQRYMIIIGVLMLGAGFIFRLYE